MVTTEEIEKKFKREVSKMLNFDENTTIVLFKFDVSEPDAMNIFCLDKNGDIRWVMPPDRLYPLDWYGNIFISDGYLIAINVSTIRYTVDPQTGEVIKSIMTK